MSEKIPSGGARVERKTGVRTAPPVRYKVLMHNDDYTTMEFVVSTLESVFRKPSAEANRIMLTIHNQGVGICGIYPHEIAETKVARVHNLARQAGFPLKCSLEEV
ncbi:MAG: ATP-dependent Clp protease adapter ClpS [Syntrophotaleaceae bacterium]